MKQGVKPLTKDSLIVNGNKREATFCWNFRMLSEVECILQKQTLMSELSVQGYVAFLGNRFFMVSSRWRSSWIRRCPIHIDCSVSESKERHREADTPREGRRPGYELQAKDANSCQQTVKLTERPDAAIAWSCWENLVSPTLTVRLWASGSINYKHCSDKWTQCQVNTKSLRVSREKGNT